MGLAKAQNDVSGLIRSRVDFDTIEARIDELPGLVDQERAALWLYAWSRQGRRWQRAKAEQLLHFVAGGPEATSDAPPAG